MKRILFAALSFLSTTVSAQFVGSPGNISYTTGNVSIGTTNASNLLMVQGTGTVGSVFQQRITNGAQSLSLGANSTAAEVQSQGAVPLYLNYGGNNTILNATGGNVGIGIAAPTAKFEVRNIIPLGSAVGNNQLVTRFGGSCGTGNYFTNNQWMVRNAAGSDWLTVKLHDGISIDGSFITPGTDTKTWWERDPNHDIQSWGNGNTLYMTINGGNVGIGTATTGGYKLAVEGKIAAREINVTTAAWPDYVFESAYELPTLEELAAYIKVNKHLPEIPSADEVEKDGVNLGEMNMLLLKKIEELTLYVIELKKQNDDVVKENQQQQQEINTLKKKVGF